MSNQKESKKNNNSALTSYARFSGIAIQMVVIIAVGTYGGMKLDEYFNNQNDVLTIILSLTSVLASLAFVIRRTISATKDKE